MAIDEVIEMSGDDFENWKLVVFADECRMCELCGEPICHVCQDHYADCDCPGPTQDGIEYKEIDGRLYGREED